MQVSIFQCALGSADATSRLECLEQVLGRSIAVEANLLVCPELFMSGYNVGDALTRLAEPVGGPFGQSVARLAQSHNKAIVYGYPEREGGRIYNSAACYGPDGSLLANHRKLALPPGFESAYFAQGKQMTYFHFGGFKFALLICYDAEFPELIRRAAEQGAQAVLAPTALKNIWGSVARRMMPTRAFENGIYVVYANHAGREGEAIYLGASCIVAPDGEDVVRADSAEEVITGSLEVAAVARAQARLPYLNDLKQLTRFLACVP